MDVEASSSGLTDEARRVLEIAGGAFSTRQFFDNDLPFRVVFGDGSAAQFETLEQAQAAWDAVVEVLQREFWRNNPWGRLKLSPVRMEARGSWLPVIPRQAGVPRQS